MIRLTDDLALSADANCFIVGRPVEKPGRGPELRDMKYYSTLDQTRLHEHLVRLVDPEKGGERLLGPGHGIFPAPEGKDTTPTYTPLKTGL